jgi:hypothetical protein
MVLHKIPYKIRDAIKSIATIVQVIANYYVTVFAKRDHFAHKIKNDFITFPGRATLGLLIDTWL